MNNEELYNRGWKRMIYEVESSLCHVKVSRGMFFSEYNYTR